MGNYAGRALEDAPAITIPADGTHLLFLSHAGIDSNAALRLAQRLERSEEAKAHDLKVWIDKTDLGAGVRWKDALQSALASSTAFAVYVGSRGVVNWVWDEVSVALDRAHKEARYPLVPILAPGITNADLPSFLSQYQSVGDTTQPEEFQKLLRAVLRLEPHAAVAAEREPFVGLQAYDSRRAHLFFGREREIEELIALLRRTSLLMITGDSGSGKSSVVLAGLVPAFRGGRLGRPHEEGPDETIWHVVETTPGTDPFGRLADSVRTAAERIGARPIEASELADLVRTRQPDKVRDAVLSGTPKDPLRPSKVLLVIDQFEEFRTSPQASAYVSALLRLATPGDDHIRVILTMRRDYYYTCHSFPELSARLQGNEPSVRYLLHRMSHEGLHASITKPLELAGIDERNREDLARAVLTDVSAQPGELALLQMALWRTWAEAKGRGSDLVRAYGAIGRVEGAMAQAAEGVFECLSPADQQRAERLFIRLVRPGEAGGATRRIARLQEFDAPTRALADKLSQEDQWRLLTIREHTVEIAHEQLATQWLRYQRWIANAPGDLENGVAPDPRGDDLRLLQSLTAEATRWDAAPEMEKVRYRVTGVDLELYEQLVMRRPEWLSDVERGFVADSANADHAEKQRREEERAERERLLQEQRAAAERLADAERVHAAQQTAIAAKNRWLAVAAMIVALVAIGFGSYTYELSIRAKERKEHAERAEKQALAEKERAERSEEQASAALEATKTAQQEAMRNFRQATQIVEDFLTKLDDEKVKKVQGFEPVRKELGEMGLNYYKKFTEQRGNDSSVRTWVWRHLGIAYRIMNQQENAIAAYRKQLEIKPDHEQAWSGLGNILVDQGKLDDAIAAYRQQVKVTPDHGDAWNNLGFTLARQNKLDDAIAAYRQQVKVTPDHGDAWNNLGFTLARQNKLDDAIAAYRQQVKVTPDHGNAWNNLGFTLARQNKLDDAIAAYRQQVKVTPDHGDAWNNLGFTLFDQGKLDDAIAAYRQQVKVTPDHGDAWNNLGFTLARQNKLDDAIAAYRQQVKVTPDHGDAWNNLGFTLFDQDELDDAIAAYRQQVKVTPDHGNAWNNLGFTLARQNKLDDAIAAYRQQVKVTPDHGDAWNNLGFTLFDQDKLDDAIAAYRQQVKVTPDHGDAWNNLGFTLARQNKLDDAIAAYRQQVKVTPDHGDAWNNLGFTLFDQDELDDAIAAYRQQVKVTPDHGNAWYNLGFTLARQNKLDDAIAAYRQQVKVTPDHGDAWSMIGIILWRQGKKTEAATAFAEGLAVHPQHLSLLSSDAELALAQGDITRLQTRVDVALPQVTPKDQLFVILPFLTWLAKPAQGWTHVITAINTLDPGVKFTWDFADTRRAITHLDMSIQKTAQQFIDFFEGHIALPTLKRLLRKVRTHSNTSAVKH